MRWSELSDDYLKELSATFDLNRKIKGCASDVERVFHIMNWVHKLWEHNGVNEPTKNDPISIVQEASSGRNFRCVEYSNVLQACLLSLGYPSRVIGLLKKDVETRRFFASHVVIETYLFDINKWIMVDCQWSVIVLQDGIPLNSYELKNIMESKLLTVEILTNNEEASKRYFKWIKDYLFYISTHYYQNGTGKRIILIPEGQPEPKIFQRTMPIIADYIYSSKLFYRCPDLSCS